MRMVCFRLSRDGHSCLTPFPCTAHASAEVKERFYRPAEGYTPVIVVHSGFAWDRHFLVILTELLKVRTIRTYSFPPSICLPLPERPSLLCSRRFSPSQSLARARPHVTFTMLSARPAGTRPRVCVLLTLTAE